MTEPVYSVGNIQVPQIVISLSRSTPLGPPETRLCGNWSYWPQFTSRQRHRPGAVHS